eukprot:3658260-Prymnesium_polylepis.1
MSGETQSCWSSCGGARCGRVRSDFAGKIWTTLKPLLLAALNSEVARSGGVAAPAPVVPPARAPDAMAVDTAAAGAAAPAARPTGRAAAAATAATAADPEGAAGAESESDAFVSSSEEEEEEEETTPQRQLFFCCPDDKKPTCTGTARAAAPFPHSFHNKCKAEHPDLRDGQQQDL